MSFDGSPIPHSALGRFLPFGYPSIVLSDSSSGDIEFSEQSETSAAVGTDLEVSVMAAIASRAVPVTPPRRIRRVWTESPT